MTTPVPRPVIGFRAWTVVDGHLAPTNKIRYVDQDVWKDGRATANCHGRPGMCGNAHNCTCGLHAYNLLERVLHWSPDDLVTGAVVAWGEIVVHRSGFRAQHAKPIAFLEPGHGPWCSAVEEARVYSVHIGCSCNLDSKLPAMMGEQLGVPVLNAQELETYVTWFGDPAPTGVWTSQK